MVVTPDRRAWQQGRHDFGGNRVVVRQSSSDPTGDALANYSGLFTPGTTTNEPALDLKSVQISRDTQGTNGFNVTMKVADLSRLALDKALADTRTNSLLYVLRFSSGFQPHAVVARYSPTGGWSFKYNNYDTLLTDCYAAPTTSSDKCLAFGANGTTTRGTVNQSTGTITMTAPKLYPGGRVFLFKLVGGQGDQQRPSQIRATSGTRFYDASAFTFGDVLDRPGDIKNLQTYLYPLDNTPAMDFLLP